MKKIIVLFGLLLSCYAFSQGENNNWYFGNKAAVTFNTNPPTALTNSAMNMYECVATISKPNGELLFYTNGNTIWNRENQIMTNGTGLTSDLSTQQVLILPHPGNINQYYVFTMTDSYTRKPSYSVIDMSLGELGGDLEPLGAVTDNKNITLKRNATQDLLHSTEAVTAVLHSDNQSYWVLIPNGTHLYSYRLDSNGFDNDNPVTSDLKFNISAPYENYGSIKASPNLSNSLDYSYLISINKWSYSSINEWKVYSFDNNIGEFTSHYEMEITSIFPYSSEFNSDGTLLYGANLDNGNIIVVDISSGNTKLVHPGWPNGYTGILQRAVNNNIYISKLLSPELYLISNPDSFINSSLDENDPNNIDLGGNTAWLGLPQLVPKLILPCNENLILNTPEVNQFMLYEVSNTITVTQNYNISPNRNITLSAGNMVEILPNSHIKNGSIFRAMIEGCENVANRKSTAKNTKPIKRTINLDDLNKKKEVDVKIYPNPTKEIITIVNTTIIDKVTITDMNGRVVKQVVLGVNKGQINISDLSQGVYILNATSNGKSVTEKIIKN